VSREKSRSVWYEDFVGTLTDVEAIRYYLEEGFKPDLLPKEEARAIWHFVREYFEESRRLSVPSIDVLEEEFPDFRFVDPNAEPHYLLSKLKQQWEHKEAQTLARTLGQYIGDHKPEKVYPYIKDKLFEMEKTLDTERNVVTVDKWDDMMANYWAKLESGDLTGYTTGFEEIDSAMGGVKNGQLAILAGRLKQGKTWFGLKAFIHQRYQRVNPIFFTLELSTEEIWERLLALWTGYSYDAISKGYVDPSARDIFMRALEREREFGPCTFIQPPPGQRQVPDLLTYVDKFKSGSMIVDQLNWLEPRRPDREYFRDDLRVADVARDLKVAAQRPGREMPVYVMHQFNRQQGKDQDLDAANYGDSDKIGQVADHLFGIQQSKELRDAKQIKFEIIESRSSRPDAFVCDFEFYEATRFGNARKDVFDGSFTTDELADATKIATLLGSSGSKQT
jgi:DnaB-like helicase C terminal domain